MINKSTPTPGTKTVRVELELSDKQIAMLFSKGRRYTHVVLCDRRMPNPRTFIKGVIVGTQPVRNTKESKPPEKEVVETLTNSEAQKLVNSGEAEIPKDAIIEPTTATILASNSTEPVTTVVLAACPPDDKDAPGMTEKAIGVTDGFPNQGIPIGGA